jgi:hypothetical protein
MQRRSSFRLSALAAVTAVAAFATQANTSPGIDATLSPLAWTVSHGEATEFRDAMAQDTMATREEVRTDLMQARTAGRLADTGEGGATERVLAQREAYVHSERERLLALNAPAPATDELDAMIAAMAESDSWNDAAYALAPEDHYLLLPDNQDPSFASTAGIETLESPTTG